VRTRLARIHDRNDGRRTPALNACTGLKRFENSRGFTERQRLQNLQNPLLDVLEVLSVPSARSGIFSHARSVGVV
jgi:hypothetical protein